MQTLKLYMKGGAVIRLPYIEDWEVEYRGNSIVTLMVKRHWLSKILPCEKLIVPSVNLSEIQALTRL